MRKISEGIVFSNDIKRILSGINAFSFKYDFIPSDSVIKDLRLSFKSDVDKIFDKKVTIISEEEMLEINGILDWGYPHCITR